MDNFKGTQGEWIFDVSDFKVRGTGDVEGRTVIANLSTKQDFTRGKNTQWANGTLIAAAPDLLEALQLMLQRFEKVDKGNAKAEYVRSLAKKAINRALNQ